DRPGSKAASLPELTLLHSGRFQPPAGRQGAIFWSLVFSFRYSVAGIAPALEGRCPWIVVRCSVRAGSGGPVSLVLCPCSVATLIDLPRLAIYSVFEQRTKDKGLKCAHLLVIELPSRFERSARQIPHDGASGERRVIGQ